MGTDGSISRLPDHLWVPAALPSVSRLGSACQLANAGHLSVPLRLRGRAHLYPCPGGDRAVAGRTGLCSACEGASLVRLELCSASPGTGPVLWLCSWLLCLPGALWRREAGVCVCVMCLYAQGCMSADGAACMFGASVHAALHACLGAHIQLCVSVLVCKSSQGLVQAVKAVCVLHACVCRFDCVRTQSVDSRHTCSRHCVHICACWGACACPASSWYMLSACAWAAWGSGDGVPALTPLLRF